MNATATTTPATVNDQYARALERAMRSGIRIVGKGTRKSDGAPIVAVSSSRAVNSCHIVTIEPTRLHCSCPARGICTHRALVRDLLLRAWTAERNRVEAIEVTRLRAALANLSAYHVRLDEALRAARPPLREAPGDAAAITQAEASRLLQRGISARVYRPDVARLDGAADVSPNPYVNNRPISIWK